MTEWTAERLHCRHEGKGAKTTLAGSLKLGMLTLGWERYYGGAPGIYELHAVMRTVLPSLILVKESIR